jgi:hypothetical protein
MEGIHDRLVAILKNAEIADSVELNQLPQDHPLRLLAEQAFGFEGDSTMAMNALERLRKKSWFQQNGLLTLCGAAIARWVFQQSQGDVLFDRLQDASTRRPTSRYRDAIKLIRLQGLSLSFRLRTLDWPQIDPMLARAIDLNVHQSLAKEDCLEHFQRLKAKHLALKLQQALSPLCYLSSLEKCGLDGDGESDGYTVGQLSEVFFRALTVHCRLALAGRKYECIWHRPGEQFEAASMNPCNARDGSNTGTPTVRLTLLPGISRVIDSQNSVGFGGFEERRTRGLENAVCLVPAVVLRGSIDQH